MKAYYFCSPEGLKILDTLEIKITPPSEFNDPFEFYPFPDHENPSIEDFRKVDAFHRASYGMFYFLCFSINSENPRMWAQYAANHTGLMLEFDLTKEPFNCFTKDDQNLIEVDYSKEDRVPVSNWSKDFKQMFYDLAARKGKYWKEEQEVRIMICDAWIDGVKLRSRETVVGDRLLKLLSISAESLVSVTLGLRSSETLVNSVQRLLAKRFEGVLLYQACRQPSGFAIIRNLIGPVQESK